ncbi:PPC domain-containing DNA-binding protein [Pedobacter mucosus]|uniref:PPC domain-containing DNA-binding protein n=1 Tax=Pedobacter mucosus TaxID=2895286 RepID=UPI001EE3C6C0|nr:PPC domain-containing DNA-binding protein [Pedobacter mucosus]UKT66005.1 DNA-binding protein [Pedobacter mucosus]
MDLREYRSAENTVETGNAPGMKVKLLSEVGGVKTYLILFSQGDEIVSGLTGFAKDCNIKSAHYSGIGSGYSAELGWFDFDRSQYLVNPVGITEVTSLIGNIAWYKGSPVTHTHATVALEDGSVKGGHLLSMIAGPTIEIFLTAEPTSLFKRLDPNIKAVFIDTNLTEAS